MENDIYQCIIKIVQKTRQPESLMSRHQKAVEANSKMGQGYGFVPNPPIDYVYSSPTEILVICFKHPDDIAHKRHEATIASHLHLLQPDIIKGCCSELSINDNWLSICSELDDDYQYGWYWAALELFANNGRAPKDIWLNPKDEISYEYAAYVEILSTLTFMPEESVEIIKISGISICLSGYIALRLNPDSDHNEIDETCTLRLSYKDGGLHLGLIRGSEEIIGNYCPTAKRVSA